MGMFSNNYVSVDNKKSAILGGNIQLTIEDDDFAQKIDFVEQVFNKIKKSLPPLFLTLIHGIKVGKYDFLGDGVESIYQSGIIYLNSLQTNPKDIAKNIIHEIAHAVEEKKYKTVYEDKELKEEFLAKKERLYYTLGQMYPNRLPDRESFLSINANKSVDQFLLNVVGYDKLKTIIDGLFVSPYATYSLREYFARGFEDFFLTSEKRKFLQQTCPMLYFKVESVCF